MWSKLVNGKALGNSALAVAFSGIYFSGTGEFNQLISFAPVALILVALLLNIYPLFSIAIILFLISLLVAASVSLKSSVTSIDMIFLVSLIFFSGSAVFFSYKIRQASFAKTRT
jgi:hypothetical protein